MKYAITNSRSGSVVVQPMPEQPENMRVDVPPFEVRSDGSLENIPYSQLRQLAPAVIETGEDGKLK